MANKAAALAGERYCASCYVLRGAIGHPALRRRDARDMGGHKIISFI